MKFKFISLYCQGEGRGHILQAIAWMEQVPENIYIVHEGKKVGETPSSFLKDYCEKHGHLHSYYDSPSFYYTNGRLSIIKTIFYNLWNLPYYITSYSILTGLNMLDDAHINFYEPIASFIKNNIFISHQLMFLHDDYVKPKSLSDKINYKLLQLYTRFLGRNSAKRLALSFYPADHNDYMDVIKPLLRPSLSKLTTENLEQVCVYMTEPSFVKQIEILASKYKHIPFYLYGKYTEKKVVNNITYHPISLDFINVLAKSKWVISTSGFETLSECKLLGKKVFFQPVPGHFEQKINAMDAEKAGIGKCVKFDEIELA